MEYLGLLLGVLCGSIIKEFALEAVANRESPDTATADKLAAMGFIHFDNATPIPTAKGRSAPVVLESGDGEVPELDRDNGR